MKKNYFRYFPSSGHYNAWGVCCTGAGFTQVTSEAHYPSRDHVDHFFTWEAGRVLQEYQIIWVTEGSGVFESKAIGVKKIRPGTAFLLFPGVWHRYQPDSQTGWMEHWIELNGISLKRLQEEKIISPQSPFFDLGDHPEVLELFQRCHSLAQTTPPGFQTLLGVLGLHILAHVCMNEKRNHSRPRRIDLVVQKAQVALVEGSTEPQRIERLAKKMKIGYSYFRRAFKKRTGFSPKQYFLQIRLRRTQELLQNTDFSIKEIASRLGFDSPFHLSADFKQRTGCSPQKWRFRDFTNQIEE